MKRTQYVAINLKTGERKLCKDIKSATEKKWKSGAENAVEVFSGFKTVDKVPIVEGDLISALCVTNDPYLKIAVAGKVRFHAGCFSIKLSVAPKNSGYDVGQVPPMYEFSEKSFKILTQN